MSKRHQMLITCNKAYINKLIASGKKSIPCNYTINGRPCSCFSVEVDEKSLNAAGLDIYSREFVSTSKIVDSTMLTF